MTDEQKALWRGIYLPEVLFGKGISGPPNMPPEITKVLRDAYDKAVHDPVFAKDLERLQDQPVAFLPGEKMQALMIDSTESFKKYLPQYKQVREEVYDRYFK
jgi:hypothetical protein